MGPIQNTGPVGSKYPIKDTPPAIKPVGNEFLEIISKQLDMIKERDDRISDLTNILLRQNAIIENNSPITEDITEQKEHIGRPRWNRIQKFLEQKYSKPPEKTKESYTTAAENAAKELEFNNKND